MPIISSNNGEIEGMLNVAKLMLIAARTAPKTGGKDDIQTLIVDGTEKDMIADEMERIGENRNIHEFKRDAQNVRDSEFIVLIGVKGSKSVGGIDCGGCGFKTCKDFNEAIRQKGLDFTGPTCVFKALDAGIAIGSASKTASELNIDNRIMYRIGAAAANLGIVEDSTIVMGIPLSVSGKNIYFDRK